MAVVPINAEKITGPWRQGFVLDRHVISSVPTHYVGQYLQFDTRRTPLGELVYQFKNKNGPVGDIVDTAVAFVRNTWGDCFDAVACPPPSVTRASQPAVVLASGVAGGLGIGLVDGAVAKVIATAPMKNVDIVARAGLLEKAIQAGGMSVRGMRLLVVDDLWQTGSTMRRVAAVLKASGATDVVALAMTRTK